MWQKTPVETDRCGRALERCRGDLSSFLSEPRTDAAQRRQLDLQDERRLCVASGCRQSRYRGRDRPQAPAPDEAQPSKPARCPCSSSDGNRLLESVDSVARLPTFSSDRSDYRMATRLKHRRQVPYPECSLRQSLGFAVSPVLGEVRQGACRGLRARRPFHAKKREPGAVPLSNGQHGVTPSSCHAQHHPSGGGLIRRGHRTSARRADSGEIGPSE